MEYIPRLLDLKSVLSKKSCFFLGPRQTGKTSLIKHSIPDAKIIDLLDEEIYLNLAQRPSSLEEYLTSKDQVVVIDEIQRIPSLLNEVHRQIEKHSRNFLLTGSSARKLRKKGTNLLGGRAWSRFLHPLVYGELKEKFDLQKALLIGTLPSIYTSESPWEDLKAYVGTYLKEEIAAEAVTRNVPAFGRFLEVSACCNGTLINYEKVSQDAMIPRPTIQSYFQILRDTLIGYNLEPWKRSLTRKAILTSKFYFFDIGVTNYLRKIKTLETNSPQFGEALETYLFHELKTYCDYHGIEEFCFWRSQSGFEVDFLINEEIGIEVKASRKVITEDFKGIRALSEEKKLKRKIIVCRESVARTVDGIEIIPIHSFLEQLWENSIVN